MKYFFKALRLVKFFAALLPALLADGKVTIRELLDIGIALAHELGLDVDTEGFSLGKNDG